MENIFAPMGGLFGQMQIGAVYAVSMASPHLSYPRSLYRITNLSSETISLYIRNPIYGFRVKSLK